ncbi:CTLH/CRA C-terminal to lish motif domain-domain-containing protein [Kockovaella imperatae]|uniref:CTLH/CRA C-terminal to lish motif domain-domain-containing protein n=1 Tax=Kockovaella imperatae TaxID=4999 RepID=A0A1Y1UEZ9_9TREE|nr:CTLH/CRA C-terminal to lish motif domain-domain-containing protein [Kockovaella imperatae]ORX36588.1 CTLH/CRA C-terminal to lish motif domain-domain-containing protein [Kockovaella imperatae]
MAYDSKGKGKPKAPTCLHDVVVDYISNQAYSATAQALTKHQRASGHGGRTTNGSSADAGRLESEDVDMSGSTSGLPTNGDVTMDVGDVESSDGGDTPCLLSDQELESIERRRAIINYILNGAIIRAVEALNTYFPAVLDTSAPASPTTSLRPMGNPWAVSPSPSASTSSLSALPAKPAYSTTTTLGLNVPPPSGMGGTSTPGSGSISNGSSTPGSSDLTIPVFPTSTTPSHVALNLQIQQFIESFRQLAPSSPSSSTSSITSLTSSMYLPVPGTNGTTTTSNGNALGASGSGLSPKITLINALTAAQGLHTEAKKLPPEVRAVYLQEIKDVGALFAYTDPETSILKGFLDQNRRIALADQVNRAILKSQGLSTTSYLEDCARRTTAIYSIISQRGVDPRPSNWKEPETGREVLLAYWKHHVGPSAHFSLREFVGQPW